jgi:SAM-dependent methyltransferase
LPKKRKGPAKPRSGRRAGQRYDADHGVKTEATVFLRSLDPDAIGPSLEDATHYEPSPVHDFERLMEHVTIAPEEATFVDLGAGMGRAVMLAALRPFRQVVGVEFSPALCEIARENVNRFHGGRRRCRDVRIVCRDAKDYIFPRGPLVVYLFNPFRGAVMEAVLERLAARRGDLNVVYHTPIQRRLFNATEAFEVVYESYTWMVYRKARK